MIKHPSEISSRLPANLILAVVLAISPTTLSGQVATRTSCSGKDPVAFIGITGVECNCNITRGEDFQFYMFRTEPRVTRLAEGTRASELLEVGDVITHVNGQLITTREGAIAFADIKPGEPVILTVRRNGQSLRYAFTPEGACPDDPRLLAVRAPRAPTARARAVPPSRAPRAVPAEPGELPGPAPATPLPFAYAPRVTPAPKAHAAPTPRPAPAPGYMKGKAPTAVTVGQERSGIFGFSLSCNNCIISRTRMEFRSPPEVWSIERGSPAERAGLRRGDVITHIDDMPIESEAGEQRFATVKPGQRVKFTVRRGNSRRSIAITAVDRLPQTAELTKSSEALVQAQQAVRELQRAQTEQLKNMQNLLRNSDRMEQEALRELQREMLNQEQERRKQITQLASELARADRQMRAAMADTAMVCSLTPAPAPGARGSRTLRYTGLVGDSEIEVRGPNPVVISERDDEVIIDTGGTQIRIKNPRRK